jgi:hypothetical protein
MNEAMTSYDNNDDGHFEIMAREMGIRDTTDRLNPDKFSNPGNASGLGKRNAIWESVTYRFHRRPPTENAQE